MLTPSLTPPNQDIGVGKAPTSPEYLETGRHSGLNSRVSRFKGTSIDLDVVRESLKDVLAIRARTISVENIQRVVSEYFRIPLKELVGPKRTRIYARPRQLAMGLARELTGDSFPEIGMAFGGRDHSTVMHACEKVVSLREEDPIFNEDYKNLLRLLQS